MFTAAIVLFFTLFAVLMIPYKPLQDIIKINITFYLFLFLLIANFFFLVKDAFNLGWFTYSDETKMQMFMGAKAFTITYMMF